MGIKVIGAGFGRTGTNTLKLALEELCFQKCYHMFEVLDSLERCKQWYDISKGNQPDWDHIFQGYQATVDWPACSFYKDILQQYPDAKVILTVRDPERWYKSIKESIYIYDHTFPKWIGWIIPSMWYDHVMSNNIIWNRTFHGKFESKQQAIAVFNQHITDVKNTVSSENLLVYNVKQGWEPLCKFLNVPIPLEKNFPYANTKENFKDIITQRNRKIFLRAGTVLGGLFLFVIGMFIIMAKMV